jgi:hypothetical protein
MNSRLKLGILVSPRTVGHYLEDVRPRRGPDPQQRWLTFVRNHAQVLEACDLFTAVTAAFRTLYVFIALDVGSRRVLQYATCAAVCSITSRPIPQRTGPYSNSSAAGGASVSVRGSGGRLSP